MPVALRTRPNKKGGFNFQIQLWERRFDKRRTLSLPSSYIKNQVSEIVIYIRDIIDSRITGRPIRPMTDAFLKSMSNDLKGRFRKVGLLDGQGGENLTLTELWERMVKVKKIEPSTQAQYQYAFKMVAGYFGAESPLTAVTLEKARLWQQWMKEEGGIKNSTITQLTAKFKAVFKDATDCQLIDENPLVGLKGLGLGVGKVAYLPISEFEKVRDCAPNIEFATLMVVCRKIGLRIPSEITALTWSNIDFENKTILIIDQKNRRHQGREFREIPLFPIIDVALSKLHSEIKPDDDDLVFPNYGTSSSAIYTLRKATMKAGLEVWSKPWNLLRESADQDLCDKYPEAVVARWLGHDVKVSRKRYRKPNQNHQQLAMEDMGF